MASIALDAELLANRDAPGAGRLRMIASVHIVWLALLAAVRIVGSARACGWSGSALSDVPLSDGQLSMGAGQLETATRLSVRPLWPFLIAAGLFNGGQGFLEVAGANPRTMLDGRFPPETLVRSLYLVTICLMAMHAGALCSPLHREDSHSGGECNTGESDRAARLTGMVLLAIAVVPSFFLFQNFVGIMLDYGYLEIYRQGNSIGSVWALSGFLAPGLIFWMAGSRDHRGWRYACVVATGLFVLLHLFLGERAAAVMCAVPIAWLVERQGRRIPRVMMVCLAAVALVVFAAVKQTRDTAWSRLSWDQQIGALGNLQNPLSSSIAEMGHTMVVVAHTISLVPAARDFDFGISYLYGASTVVPNVGWDIHPSVSHGLLCDWITRTVEPMVAAAGGGLGYSFIAEAYLNFGWIGGPLFLARVGYAFCRFFHLGDSPDPARQALAAAFLSVILVFARGESAIVARGVVWYAIAPYLLARVLTARRRKRVSEAAWIS